MLEPTSPPLETAPHWSQPHLAHRARAVCHRHCHLFGCPAHQAISAPAATSPICRAICTPVCRLSCLTCPCVGAVAGGEQKGRKRFGEKLMVEGRERERKEKGLRDEGKKEGVERERKEKIREKGKKRK
jgi:hypothetical protein